MKIKFGTSGWRDIIADGFTFENVRRVSKAIATFLLSRHDSPEVIVGFDTRFMTEKFAEVVSGVLTANGVRVHLCEEPVPTPVISHAIISQRLSGGVNITASHNPPEYCGIKFNPESGGPALPEVTEEIERLIDKIQAEGENITYISLSEAHSSGRLTVARPKEAYLSYLEKLVDFTAIKKAELNVVVDLLYGTAKGYLDEILKRHGLKVKVLHDYRDPYFGGHRPEPDGRRLGELGERVRATGAYLGLATDGDADRFGIVDDEGNAVSPNEFIALVAEHLYTFKGLKGPVGRSIATSKAIEIVAAEHGEVCTVTPVGFKFLGPLAAEKGYVVVGEESGGLTIQNHVAEKDGILACLIALEMVALQGKPLSEIRRDFRRKYGEFYTERIDLELMSEEEKSRILEKFAGIGSSFAGLKVMDSNRIDGYFYAFENADSWLLARPSGTEPVIRVYLESRDLETFKKLKEEVLKQL
ncbi:MAG: hypothetical protein PWP37_29 [Thermotogota bacterium]|nr:hypothetical protein [Thermotogota bacterium]MDK2863837.1 hypothetical protein [Thermotogota bacterium]HCZ05977.1 phosphoglucomutase [Thermotogota bacterium]